MKIAIRVDASTAIGTGHVKRCLSLAKALRSLGGEVVFVWRDLGLDCAGMFGTDGFADLVMVAPDSKFVPGPGAPPHAGWLGVAEVRDADQFAALVRHAGVELVIVDHYGLTAQWHETVRAALGVPIVAIDDLADRPLACNVLIDHNLATDHRQKYRSVMAGETRIFGGPRFALLDPIYETATRYRAREDMRLIGVFMGGADLANATATVLDAIEASTFEGAVEIVSTGANPHLADLQKRCAAQKGWTLSVDLADLAGFFARHDLQIGAGGGATWERCCIGAPSIGVVVADNQRASLVPLAEMGVLAIVAQIDAAAVAEQINRLAARPADRLALAEGAAALVDGRGAVRIAAAVLRDRVRVRPATIDDARRMHGWRNAPSTRAVSRESQPIDYDSHVAWLESVLATHDRHSFIGMLGERPVGVIRLDALDAGDYEVSLYLDPDLTGLGLGPALLRSGEDSVSDARRFVATVLPGNPASAKLFARNGYCETSLGRWDKPATGRSNEEFA